MILHVLADGHEWIGEAKTEGDHTIRLTQAVKLMFVNDQRGVRMIMNNLKNDNNYDGCVSITNGPGVAILRLQELGELAKKYRQARSDIQIISANSKIAMN